MKPTWQQTMEARMVKRGEGPKTKEATCSKIEETEKCMAYNKFEPSPTPTFLVPPLHFPFLKITPPFLFISIFSIQSIKATLTRRVVAKASAKDVAPKVLNCARRKAINGLSKVTSRFPQVFLDKKKTQELEGVHWIAMVYRISISI